MVVWIQEVELPRYNPAITNTTPTHTRKCMEDEWEEKCKLWYIQKGFLRGVTMNMRDTLDEQYYSQLKNINTAYHNTTLIQILIHLNIPWCPLNMQAHKILKKEFYTNWDSSGVHITVFGMKLVKEQNQQNWLGIIISNKDKLEFYLKQIYATNCFDKTEMVTWENKPIIIRDNYTQAKAYFKNLVKDFQTYMQNSGGKTWKMGYESANHMADVGNEIRKYIQDIASATVADKERTAENLANISEASRAKNAQIDSIRAQISSSPTPLHFSQNFWQTRRTMAVEETLAEEMAAEEMVKKAVVLGANKNGYPPETWATIAGPADITQLA
jgi:hypothetical protein